MNRISQYLNNFFNKRQGKIFVLGIVFVSVFWRLYRLNQIPQGLNLDEYNLVNYLIELTQSGWKIRPEYLYNGLYLYLMAGFGYLTQFNVLYLRILQAILGVFSVYLFYELIRSWFNRQTALLAGLFLATSSFHVLFSRNLEPLILFPIVVAAVLYTLTLSLRTNKSVFFILSGILIGLTYYVDKIFLVLPFLLLATGIYMAVANPKLLKAYRVGFALTFVTSLLMGIPYFYYLPKFWNTLKISFNPGSIGNYYLNLGNNLLSLFHETPLNNVYNVGTEPIFDPFVSIAFVCGLIYALFYLRRKKFLILLNWFLVGVFALSFLRHQNFSNYLLIILPIITLASIMLDYVLTHWVRTFPFNKAARLLMTVLFSTFLFMSIFYNYQRYFWAWGSNETIQSNYQYKIDYHR